MAPMLTGKRPGRTATASNPRPASVSQTTASKPAWQVIAGRAGSPNLSWIISSKEPVLPPAALVLDGFHSSGHVDIATRCRSTVRTLEMARLPPLNPWISQPFPSLGVLRQDSACRPAQFLPHTQLT
jgi:hypothetical protein